MLNLNKQFFGILTLIASISPLSALADDPRPLHGPLKVNFLSLTDFSPEETAKIHKAADYLELVLNSEEFKAAVLNFTYEGKKQFIDNQGLTNEQIYETLRAGKETLIGKEDESMDLDLELYTPPAWKKRSVVGYTYADTLRIWINRYYFTDFTPAEIAGNLAHEWCHKLGFTHDYKRTKDRPASVPYAIGYIVADLMARQLGQADPAPASLFHFNY